MRGHPTETWVYVQSRSATPYGYGYPYGSGYGYDSGAYDGGSYYNGQNSYDQGGDNSYDQSNNYNQRRSNSYDQGRNGSGSYDRSPAATVADVQALLAREGYYRGQIDGVLGPETRHALLRYQSKKGLGMTGSLTMETQKSLGLGQASPGYGRQSDEYNCLYNRIVSQNLFHNHPLHKYPRWVL